MLIDYANASAHRFESLTGAYPAEDVLYKSDHMYVIRDSWADYEQAFAETYTQDYGAFMSAVREAYQLTDDSALVPIQVIIESMERAEKFDMDMALCHGGKLLMVVRDGQPLCFAADSECGVFVMADANLWGVEKAYVDAAVLDSSRCSFGARVNFYVHILGKKIYNNEFVSSSGEIRIKQLKL